MIYLGRFVVFEFREDRRGPLVVIVSNIVVSGRAISFVCVRGEWVGHNLWKNTR